MSARFTIDGSEALERHLEKTCAEVVRAVRSAIGPARVKAIVLGGGYGRGEGGVLRSGRGDDEPYNDLEFYVFLHGSRLLNQRRFNAVLNAVAAHLSGAAKLHVEFKIESLARLRRSPVSMFSYDLVAGHRIVDGQPDIFDGCKPHLQAGDIPVSEATRLLCNRCTGLLLAKELLASPTLSTDEADFVGRNLAKAQLALGDAVLTCFGQYHWSVRERHQRLNRIETGQIPPRFQDIRAHHTGGVQFKLHPQRSTRQRESFEQEHQEICGLAQQLWLWLESHRLNRRFRSALDYAFFQGQKCPDKPPGQNYLLNLRTFGLAAAFDRLAGRYPRERLFNSLPVLLWDGELEYNPQLQNHLRRQLRSSAADWAGFVNSYKQLWPIYG
jgi:hypothetical protein